MIKNRTRAFNRQFTENGVTPRHFVTSEGGCDDPTRSTANSRDPGVVVSRLYQPETAVLDALVEALYGLLIGPTCDEPVSASEPLEPACCSGAPE